jgi:hypothetical protein
MWTMSIGTFVTIIAALRILFEERFLRSRDPEHAAYVQVTKAIALYVI